MNPLAKNTEVWNNMFDWIERRNASRKYPNETVVTWILGYANTHKSLSREERKVLDVGCGWCQSISVFINEGFTYYGVDVTSVAFPRREELAGIGWSDNVHLSIFNPPKLDYPDNYFSHAFSTEALHLNPDKEAMTAIIAVPLSLLLGITAALYRNTFYDRAVNASALTTISMPEFFVAYILIIFLASIYQFFPSLSNVTSSTPFLERIYLSILPALTLTLVTVAHMMRMTRAAIINLLSSPYIEMAELKGLSRSKVIMKHALPNAWAPISNIIAFNLAYLIVGVVVVEVVFVYPGVGQLMVDSVIKRDIPVVQGCALVFALTYILLNLLADVISIITNPRLLYPK